MKIRNSQHMNKKIYALDFADSLLYEMIDSEIGDFVGSKHKRKKGGRR